MTLQVPEPQTPYNSYNSVFSIYNKIGFYIFSSLNTIQNKAELKN